ncbi:MAG: DUF4125 family protein [Oscillospiraceae bacterium]
MDKMDIKEILRQLDELFEACELDRAGKFLSESIEQALKCGEFGNAITLLNEQIGFFRDCGRFDEALASCNRVLELITKCGLENTAAHATTLLNAANAYRASGRHAESFAAYEKVKEIYDSDPDTPDHLYASYYNNLSLLYQQTGEHEKACECQYKALETVLKTGDEQRAAISRTNLAVSLIRLGRVDEAEQLLLQANEFFVGLSPSDFHYSAALSAMGDVKFHQGKFEQAKTLYEMALAETELHMGKNNFYDIIRENLALVKEKLPQTEQLNGLAICRAFYECFGKPMIHRNFAEYEDRIVCGMVGEGSDCLGFDDKLSQDHDFGPAFCIWLDEELFDKIGERLKKAYDLLPKRFMDYERVRSPQSRQRTGVFQSVKFYTDLLETDRLLKTAADWLSLSPERLAAATNGEIFTQSENEFTRIRKTLKNGYPYAVRLKHIAQQTALAAQSGQYNFSRCLKRGDSVTAGICFGEFVKSALRCVHLLDGRYYPYYKWLAKSAGDTEITSLLEKEDSLPKAKWAEEIISPVCEMLRTRIAKKLGICTDSDYLDGLAYLISERADEIMSKEKLAYRIAEMEFEAFDKVKNEGGRASCQDDWQTFSIMRVSQYLTWSEPMLRQYIADFEAALSEGRNLITEKYARMMRSTAPEKYAEIESSLPPTDPDAEAVVNAVCSIQVTWMEEFAKDYPMLAMQARVVHTYEDTEWDTSYETYLRGELLTYSRQMLTMYAQFVVGLANSGENLAKMTMENSARAYGYKSIEQAEEQMGNGYGNSCCGKDCRLQ